MSLLSWRTLTLPRRKTTPGPSARAPEPAVIAPADGPWNYNRKHTDPSRLMTEPDGGRYRCSWIEGGLSIQSDGNVTCGLDDPHSRRSFGNIYRQSLAEIWTNPEYETLQARLWEGRRCTECNLSQAVADDAPDTLPARPERPTTLVVETTVRCNLRCDQPACKPNNDRDIKTRDSDFLELDAFASVMDDLEGSLSHVFFFNYGDPFVNVQAADMLEHIQRTNPQARVNTTTNGIPLSNLDRARKVVAAGALDFIQFTISGVTQEAYGRYHVGGRLDLAMKGMANLLQARRELGVTTPRVQWRYLVFDWNDTEAEVEEALRLAEDYGVDEFRLHLTHVPLTAISTRFARGGPMFSRYRAHIDNAFGYTQHCPPAPNDDGVYHLEGSPEERVRWTSWQARKTVRVRNGTARIAFMTNRPGSDVHTTHVFVVTPWQRLKVPVAPDGWHSISLIVPDATAETITVELFTLDDWNPTELTDGWDTRGLGVLMLEDDEHAEGLPVWTTYAEVTPEEQPRLDAFRYEAPAPLIDW